MGNFSLFKTNAGKTIGFFIIFSLITFLTILIHPTLSIQYLLAALHESYTFMLTTSKTLGKVAFEFHDLQPDIGSILWHSPKALMIGLFRPFVWESPLNFTLLVGVEGFIILILLAGKIYQQIKGSFKISLETIALLTYVFLTAIMMSLISPNWGTLIRYKIAFLPFWILFLCLNNPVFLYIENSVANIFSTKSKNRDII